MLLKLNWLQLHVKLNLRIVAFPDLSYPSSWDFTRHVKPNGAWPNLIQNRWKNLTLSNLPWIIFYMRKRFSVERVHAKSMKILAFTELTLAFPFHQLWQILKRPFPKSEQDFIFMKIWQRELIFRAVKCLHSRSFRGLCPLDPHQGSALDPLGGSQRPQTPSCKFFTTRATVRFRGWICACFPC